MKILIITALIILISISSYSSDVGAQDSFSKDKMITAQQSASQVTLKLTPDEMAALVNETGKRTTQMAGIIFYKYTYTQTDVEYELDQGGRVTREKSKTYEVYPVRGRSYVRVQLSENGIPLSPEKIERERKRAAEELAKAEEEMARIQNRQIVTTTQTSSKRFSSFGITLTLRTHGGLGKLNLPIRPTDFLLSHELYAPRRTMLNNREAILFNFRPRPNFVFDQSNTTFQSGLDDFNRLMAQLGGRIWIDAAEKVIARVEVSLLKELNSPDVSTSDMLNADVPLGFESVRLPNGVWVPSRSWLNAYGREKIFGKVAIVSHAHKYGDFKMFSTEVKDVIINPPESPQ